MVAKAVDWTGEVQDALKRLQKPGLVFEFEASAALIDYLASRMVVFGKDLHTRAAAINGPDTSNFLQTTLANITTAIHKKGAVPDPGGWYFHDAASDAYVLDRGFSFAWRAARSSNGPD